MRSRSELRRDIKSEGIAALHRGEGKRTLFSRNEVGSSWPINIAFYKRNVLIDKVVHRNNVKATKTKLSISKNR